MIQNKPKAVARLILLLMLLNILDLVTTFISLDLGGSEANPLMLYAMEHLGGVWGLLYVKLAIMFPLLPYLVMSIKLPDILKSQARPAFITGAYYVLIPVNLFYAYIVVHNIYVIHVLRSWQ